MLILAGVSINAIVGEDGVLTKAQEVKQISEDSARREALEMILFEYNSSKFLGEEDGITSYLATLKDNETIDEYAYFGELMVKYDGEYYTIRKDGEYYKVGNKLSTDLSENAAGGNYIVNEDNANETGNLEFTIGSTYAILDKISAEGFNFYIPSAQGNPENAVTIYLTEDMKIDNQKYPGRSAIELEDGAILNLYVYGNVEVNSSYGKKGGNGSSAEELNGGVGANAGIHVTQNSTLNLYGTGIIKCYGGDAGDGGTCIYADFDMGAAGGGGAGAGIGGNGGDGADSTYFVGGTDGKNGENCGNINIYDSIEVYAFGGGGGSGGKGTPSNGKGGGGGGAGYPAAGIGGGGAGGGSADTAVGGGGFSGSASECKIDGAGINGGVSEPSTTLVRATAGSYFSTGIQVASVGNFPGAIGGGGLFSEDFFGGNGGVGGKGRKY